MANKKIGILTWHYYPNFGSGLQAFALQSIIQSLGYEGLIINYRNPIYGKSIWWKNFVKKIIYYTLAPFNKRIKNKVISETAVYQKKYLNQTRPFYEPSNLCEISKDYNCIVYGSDQIWAPNVYNPIYMGAYVSNHVRKISYAASIGLNDIPDDMVETYKNNLSTFHAVAVREQEGKELLKNRCGIDASVVLDPTLMVGVDVYRKMQRTVDGIEGKYIFCYFLNKDHRYVDKVIQYAKEYNLQIVGVSDKPDDASWMNRLTNVGADQFLWLINHAETIFTDSYHGSIFSLLFHKNLWTFVRFAEDSPICQNSRIRQLQANFNIAHRIISAKSEIDDDKSIDYDYFENRLVNLRESSLLYLKKALE